MGRFFEARKHTIFARSARVSKLFTRVAKEIAMAVKAGGGSAEANPALRRAIQNARSASMPKDKIEAAIKRASDKDTSDYHEAVYEGYAPHGVALVVVAATDNPTRTVANIRNRFNKGGGNMGAEGSVTFGFTRMGTFRIKPEGIDRDDLELSLIDHGLEELTEGTTDGGQPVLVLRCSLTCYGALQNALEERKVEVLESSIDFVPQNTLELADEAQADEVLKLVGLLEDDDDVQQVFHNLA
jgi:YebC/PmpR family DNA-binding regulatory protein